MNETQLNITEPVIAININQTYRYGISANELYDCTRGIWRLSKSRAEHAQYAFAVYKGIIREVYEVKQWFPAGSTKYQRRQFNTAQFINRYEFIGKVASDEIRDKYVNKQMPELHSQNPIRYYNC